MRALGWFWASVVLLCGIGAGVLQLLGPPGQPHVDATGVAPPSQVSATVDKPAVKSTEAASAIIAPPDPALLQAVAVPGDRPGDMLPKIGADHRVPSQVYAAAFDPQERRPLVAILLGGIGMSQSDSQAAINNTPPPIALAFTPYAVQPDGLLTQARQHGHELLISIPMEPRGYPLDDPGNEALLVGNKEAVNDQHLVWALSRIQGYIGATGALGALRGERFADSPVQFEPMLAELHDRGLLYLDPRPWAELPSGTGGRAVDVVIDEIPGAAEIDAKFARLEEIAKLQGAAIGLLSLPRPVTLERLTAWAAGLSQRGLALAPVSTVAKMPVRPIANQQAGAVPVAAQQPAP